MKVLWAVFVLLSVGGEPTWRIAREPGFGCWPPKCGADQVPLATPLVAHAGKLVMIGDGAAPHHGYESTDGKRWRVFEHDAAWGVRYQAADASYRGALWRVAGFVQDGNRRTPMNDVWRSTDGRHWERVLSAAPWPPRAGGHLVVLRDTLFLIGGEPHDDQIWITTDGKTWLGREARELPSANPQNVVAFHDSLWIIGRGQWENATNDVWVSADGEKWNRVLQHATWSVRTGPSASVLGGRIWVVAGFGHNDVWYSLDGRHWTRHSSDLPGPPRGTKYSTVFQDRLWVVGGKTGGAGGTGFWDGVVVLE
jgi:leucine-zipper-like transcriptional regulator 1